MADVLDDILSAAGGDVEEVKYVREHIPSVLQTKFDDEQLQYIIDVIFEYIDSKEEDEDIIEDDVAQYVVAQAEKENFGKFEIDDISLIVDVDLDYLESED